MILDDQIDSLAQLFGIEAGASTENQVFLLQSMGVLPEDFNPYDKDKVFANSLFLKDLIKTQIDAEYKNVVHQVSVMRKNRVEHLVIALPDGVDKLSWELNEENCDCPYRYEIDASQLEPVKNNDGSDCSHSIDGVIYRKYKFSFPFDIGLGYHNVKFSFKHPNSGNLVEHTSRIISAPEKCYDRLGIDQGKKTWGVPVQLYEQVSENNLGIGNFSDLAQLGHILGKNGAGIIGVNPLHAMRDDQPENASPYEPDSRMFFNYIYLDVTAIKEFKNSPEIQKYYHSSEFQEKIKANRRKTYVDYAITQELVDDIVGKCFDKFCENKKSEDYKRFCVFCDKYGDDLEMYALYRALSRYMAQQNPPPVSWQQWPKQYKNPNSPEVRRFQYANRDWINFYKYSQWQCHDQLQKVQEACLNSGMAIGLYTDNAVGSSRKGFEAWYYQGLFMKAAAGAPPDILSQGGQNWSVQGFNPIALRQEGYEPYRKILEANMKFAGCTRIDHVLQLQRLYMIPEGKSPKEGAFIYYNSDELMAIVALESHRNKTMVIGEDLGVIPEGFRPKLEDFGILSYRVLPFEREMGFENGSGNNAMRHPEEYPLRSVCATSTHDTPPLAAQWNVQDIYQKLKLGLIDQEQANKKFEQFATQRESLNYALQEKGCWERVGGHVCYHPREDAPYIPEKYVEAVTDYLGQSNSAIMLIPFSDIFGTKEMGNIPGIKELPYSDKQVLLEINEDKAYPNWRKKMHIPVEHVDKIQIFKDVAKIVNGYRADGNNGKGLFFQFQRMGEQQQPVISFEHYQSLYNILKNQKKFQQENMLRVRYGDAYKNRIQNRTQRVKNYFHQTKNAYDAFRLEQLRSKVAAMR